MSLFNLFKKKPQGPEIIDQVWISKAAKEQTSIRMAKQNPRLTFIAWSELTRSHFQKLFSIKHLNAEVMLANDALPTRMRGKEFVFLEHHFYRQKEVDMIKSWNAQDALFLNSFDDPVFLLFELDRIKPLVERLGHDESEPIVHAMITKSIKRAQEKIVITGLPDDCPESVKKWLALIK